MHDDSLIEIFRQLGFSEYEARCYLALFKKDSLAVSEVAKLSGIPRPNAYDALEKLMAEGFIVSVPGKTKRFAVSDPDHLRDKSFLPMINAIEFELENIERKKEKSDRIIALQKNMDNVLRQLQTLYQTNRSNDNPLEYMEVLKNPAQVHRRVVELFGSAKIEMIGFTKPPYSYIAQSPEKTRIQFKEQIKSVREAVKRGLSIRNIYELPQDKDQVMPWFEIVKEGCIPEVEDRAVDSLPLKMVVFDRRFVVYQLEDPIQRKPSTTSLVTEHPALANGFAAMFEYYWERAQNHFTFNNHKYFLTRTGRAIKREKPSGN